MPTILLVDNGSTKAPATLQLRKIAEQLSQRSGELIHPVSLQHAGSIPASELDGSSASVFIPFLEQQLTDKKFEFIVLPLFFGKSRALTKFIPDSVKQLQDKFPELTLKVSDVLFPLPQGDSRLATILYEHIHQTASRHSLPLKNIAIVDHGSPLAEVTQVRNSLTESVQRRLGENIFLEQAVMERRADKEYDFNGMLLEDWLSDKAEQGESSAIITLLFSSPGRHAGPGGDIATICESVAQRYPYFKIGISPLIGEHPLLIDILQDRLESTAFRFS